MGDGNEVAVEGDIGIALGGIGDGQIADALHAGYLATFRRQFRILMIDVLEPILVPPVLKILTEQAPSIQIESITGYRVDFVNAILTGTLDLAFFVYPITVAATMRQVMPLAAMPTARNLGAPTAASAICK